MTQNHNKANNIIKLLFVIYLLALCWILLFKLGVRFSYMEERRVNLVPFNGRAVLHGEAIMNVVIFLPFGMYAGILFQRWTFGKKCFFFFISSFLFEALQFIFKTGAFDVTDIITNTIGGVLGLILFQSIGKLFSNTVKKQYFINIIAVTGTVLLIIMLVLLKLNLLPVRYQ